MATPNFGFYSQRTPLGATSYIFTFRYNARMDRWLMDVADANAKVLLTGVPLLTGWASTRAFIGIVAGLPTGYLVPMDLTGAQRDPQENTFSNDVPLFYLE